MRRRRGIKHCCATELKKTVLVTTDSQINSQQRFSYIIWPPRHRTLAVNYREFQKKKKRQLERVLPRQSPQLFFGNKQTNKYNLFYGSFPAQDKWILGTKNQAKVTQLSLAPYASAFVKVLFKIWSSPSTCVEIKVKVFFFFLISFFQKMETLAQGVVTVIHQRPVHQVVHRPLGEEGKGKEQRRIQLGTPAQRPTLLEGLDLRQIYLRPTSLSFLIIRSGRLAPITGSIY